MFKEKLSQAQRWYYGLLIVDLFCIGLFLYLLLFVQKPLWTDLTLVAMIIVCSLFAFSSLVMVQFTALKLRAKRLQEEGK